MATVVVEKWVQRAPVGCSSLAVRETRRVEWLEVSAHTTAPEGPGVRPVRKAIPVAKGTRSPGMP